MARCTALLRVSTSENTAPYRRHTRITARFPEALSPRTVISPLTPGDLQQRDNFAAGGQAVFGDAVVAEFKQFLAADAGHPQYFNRRERPERLVVLVGQVAPFAGGRIVGPDVAADRFG